VVGRQGSRSRLSSTYGCFLLSCASAVCKCRTIRKNIFLFFLCFGQNNAVCGPAYSFAREVLILNLVQVVCVMLVFLLGLFSFVSSPRPRRWVPVLKGNAFCLLVVIVAVCGEW
jgi:hypothetical protein